MKYLKLLFVLPLFFLLLCPINSAAQSTNMIGWYFPVNLGATWHLGDPDNPSDTFTESVFEAIIFEGQEAYRLGENMDNHTIVARTWGVLTVLAEVDEGVLIDLEPNLELGELIDGDTFEICFETPCDTTLIRVWENLDPALRSIYEMDPSFTDMIVMASYDPDYAPNLHNVVLESNFPDGLEPPSGAVTNLDFYLRGTGLVAMRDIDAETGGVVENLVLLEVTPVEDRLPTAVVLQQNVPNPFNPRTTIRYQLDEPADVTLQIYDCTGRLVRELLAGVQQESGGNSVIWDGTDNRGRALPSGAYICRIEAGGQANSRKVTLLR